MLREYTPDEMIVAIHCDEQCKKIGAILAKAYPNRRWYVRVLDKGKMCYIYAPDISMGHGMSVHLMGTPKQNMKKCKMAAGEILERYKLSRSITDNTDVNELIRNIFGDSIFAEKGEL